MTALGFTTYPGQGVRFPHSNSSNMLHFDLHVYQVPLPEVM